MLTRRAVLTAGAATAVAPQFAREAASATPAGIVVMAKQIDDIVSFDPAQSYEFTDNEVDGNLYRKLVVPDPLDPSAIKGDLATNFEITPEGRRITFHLRDDARFASGRSLTAADAEFSLRRAARLNLTPGFIITQFGFTKDNVAGLIRATDTHTLVVEVPEVAAPSFVLHCLSANVGGIVEKETALAHQEGGDLGNRWLTSHSAGAGAYQLTSWAANDHVIVDANPHSGIPTATRRIVIRHVKDPATQLLMLRRGDADIARDLTSDLLKSIGGERDFHSVSSPQLTSMYLAANQNVTALTRPEVQQAMKWAIDYEAIARNITPGTWTVDQSFLPAGLFGALSSNPFHRDVAKARSLMAAGGYPDGFAVTMDYISAPPYSDIAEALQADLGAIGIKVSLLPGTQKEVITKMRARQHQLLLLYWGSDYFDPNSNAQAFCANPDDSDASPLKIIAWRCHFQNKPLTAEAAAAAREVDSAKRLALYEKMQRQFWDQAPITFLLQKNAVAVLRSNVSGFVMGAEPDFTRYHEIRKG
ncbi:MAG: ABC transporter substrate-binding protein [Acetobacteraceae bacterium]